VLLAGDDLREFKRAGVVRYSPPNIFLGVLLGLQQEVPTVNPSVLRPILEELIVLISNDAGSDPPEFTLSAAAKLREEFGHEVSMSALRTAREIFEDDTKITSDYMMDAWVIQEGQKDWDQKLMAEIAETGAGLDLGDIAPEILPAVAYVTVLALSHVDKRRAATYLKSVGHKVMNEKLAAVVEKASSGIYVSLDEARFLALAK
jgi:hypothetical protein